MEQRIWIRAAALGLALVGLLTACAPAAAPQAPPEVAVVHAPAEERVSGLAEVFIETARTASGMPELQFTSRNVLSAVEVRRDLTGSRAVPNAARIARSYGADFAVMLAPSLLEREVVDLRGNQRRVRVDVRVRGALVRPEDAAVLAETSSRRLSGSRLVTDDEELPPETRDPTALELAEEGTRDVAPFLLDAIARQLSGSSSE